MNVPRGDEGGELDPHGADGNGNPVGSVVTSSQFGGLKQIKEWHQFIGSGEFCIRICNPSDPDAWKWCQHIYDVMGALPFLSSFLCSVGTARRLTQRCRSALPSLR